METTVEKKREIIIRINMMEQDVTGAEIARRIGVTRNAVNTEIKGERKSRKIREAICEHLGLTYSHLWGKEE
jgi:predicted transcriptional regulator